MHSFSFAKRALLGAYDLISALIVTALLVCALAQPAWAYVDPSVMTYTIQALAGVAVALSAVAGVALRRTRKVIFKMLKIDENANKIVDPAIVVVSPGDTAALAAADEAAREAAERAAKGRPAPKLTWGKRFLIALAVTLLAAFTLLIASPFELVSGNGRDLVYGIGEIMPPLVILAVLATAVIALILSLFRGKAYKAILALVLAVGVGFWAEGMWLNNGLPSANGSAIAWGHYNFATVLSDAVWVVIALVLVVAAFVFSRQFCAGAVFVSLALVLVQGVGMVSLAMTHQDDAAAAETSASASATADIGNLYVSQLGMFDVSPTNNVIVFCLDTVDVLYMDRMLTQFPNALESFTGFTYFNNTVGSYTPTRYGVPYLLTGEYAHSDETWTHYNETRFTRSTFLDDIQNAGYSVGIYTDSLINGMGEVSKNAFNIIGDKEKKEVVGDSSFDPLGSTQIMIKTSLYRNLPWSFKPAFWYYTDQINTAMTNTANAKNSAQLRNSMEYSPYIMNDVVYYNNLTSYRLEADDEGEAGAFRFIHLNGSHSPCTMNEFAEDRSTDPPVDPEYPSTTVTRERQTKGAFFIVEQYLNQLKALGLYDQATIVITSDHGWLLVEQQNLAEPMRPLMLVKPGNQTHQQASEPCKTSSVPTGHADFNATVAEATGTNTGKYGTTVWQVTDKSRVRYFEMLLQDGISDWAVYEYAVYGDAANWENWYPTGQYWDVEDWWKTASAKGTTLKDLNWELPPDARPETLKNLQSGGALAQMVPNDPTIMNTTTALPATGPAVKPGAQEGAQDQPQDNGQVQAQAQAQAQTQTQPKADGEGQ